MWCISPLATRLHKVAKGVEELAEWVLTLWGVFTHENEVGKKELLFHIRNISGIGLSRRVHYLT